MIADLIKLYADANIRVAELERENAALRTVLKRWLKVADDCHQEQQEVGYSEYNITVGLMCDTRALLDAARKEAQPWGNDPIMRRHLSEGGTPA